MAKVKVPDALVPDVFDESALADISSSVPPCSVVPLAAALPLIVNAPPLSTVVFVACAPLRFRLSVPPLSTVAPLMVAVLVPVPEAVLRLIVP